MHINVLFTVATPTGYNETMLDAHAVQHGFTNIVQHNYRVDADIIRLEARIAGVEKFLGWLEKNHPDIPHEYAVATAAKDRIGV